jgi:hypothetical protein
VAKSYPLTIWNGFDDKEIIVNDEKELIDLVYYKTIELKKEENPLDVVLKYLCFGEEMDTMQLIDDRCFWLIDWYQYLINNSMPLNPPVIWFDSVKIFRNIFNQRLF